MHLSLMQIPFKLINLKFLKRNQLYLQGKVHTFKIMILYYNLEYH